MQQTLEDEVAAFESIMETHALDQRVRQWLRASAYATYELLAVCRDEMEMLDRQVRDGGCLCVHLLKEQAQTQAWHLLVYHCRLQLIFPYLSPCQRSHHPAVRARAQAVVPLSLWRVRSSLRALFP